MADDIDETHEEPRRTVTRPATAEIALSVPGYRVEGTLGRGGMGVVYRAVQLSLGRPVALKVVLSGVHVSEKERQRFAAEARALASLQHANVVQVIDFGESNGLPWFALEFCPGGSLSDRLADGPLHPAEAAEVVATLAKAVDAVHRRGLIHRDLKPANVLFTEDGTPKVADFGLVRDEEGTGTVTGAALGTPAYMAPEQARGEPVDARADVYALGAILYQCLTGRPPFSGPSAQVVLAMVITGHVGVIPPRQINPAVPEWLEAVCGRALARDPSHRYANAGELAAALALPGAATARVMQTLPVAQVLPVAATVNDHFAGLEAAEPARPAVGGEGVWWPAWLAAAAVGCLALACVGAGTLWWALAGRSGPVVVKSVNIPPQPAEKPLPLRSPANAAKAKAAQEAWAAWQREEVDADADLGGGVTLTTTFVPPGTFTMGSPGGETGRDADEGPAHEVTISRPFRAGKTEVTRAQFRQFVRDANYKTDAERDGKGGFGRKGGVWAREPGFFWDNMGFLQPDDAPVVNVTWNDAKAFCRWVSGRTGKAVTLPTEAQWEWACRAGSQAPYSFGDSEVDLPGYAWYDESITHGNKHTVGRKKPNPFGLHDVHGNVLEWCRDVKRDYAVGSKTDPVTESEGGNRAIRGGSWNSINWCCRSAYRRWYAPDDRHGFIGFRVCLPGE